MQNVCRVAVIGDSFVGNSKVLQFIARSLIMFLSVLILHKMTPTPDLVTCGDGGIRKQEERVINYLLLFKGLLEYNS